LRSGRASVKKRALTRDEIVRAAEHILEKDGYEGLTIRNVAARLGVKSASLYWHFATKEELEDALADELLARVSADYVEPGDWKENIRQGSLHMMRRLLSIRDSSRLLAGRFLTGPNALRWMERCLKPFLEAGLGKREVAYASHAIHVYIQGFVIFRSAPLSAMESKGSSKAKVLGATRKKFQGLSPTTFPNIVALADALTDADIEARFLFGLDCLIAGLAQRAGAKAAHDSSLVSKR
jgi:TetR/AcrR family tetracycline transcriptional repressor